MPQYLVKVEDEDGWLSPPIVVAAQNETRAEAVLRLLIADNCTVTMMGLRQDVMEAAFGQGPEGCATFSDKWRWSEDHETAILGHVAVRIAPVP